MKRSEHRTLSWCVEHLMIIYIALVVTAILPLIIVELIR